MKPKPWRKSLMLKKCISTFLSEQVCFLFQLHSASLSPIRSAICTWESQGTGEPLLFVLLPLSRAVVETGEQLFNSSHDFVSLGILIEAN